MFIEFLQLLLDMMRANEANSSEARSSENNSAQDKNAETSQKSVSEFFAFKVTSLNANIFPDVFSSTLIFLVKFIYIQKNLK